MSDTTTSPNKLLVLMIDGFKWDYFDNPRLDLPGFKQLFNEGVKSEYLEPVFPSLSYTNYYSLMTGLYAEDHGMVGNYMYNENRDEYFNMMENEECKHSHWWEGAEPFWITAVKQGRRTCMLEWSGGEFPQNGVTSTYSKPLEKWPMLPEMKQNIQTAIEMFKNDEIDMAGVYVAELDESGHFNEKNSQKLGQTIQEVDKIIKFLLDELNARSLRDSVNIVIFSDHGMAEISESKSVDISEHLNTSDVKVFTDRGNMCNIWPHEGKLDKVYSSLKEMNDSHIHVYKKDELPNRWHYSNHRLVPPITVTADVGWFILTPQYPTVPCKGFHGYDNKEQDMRGIFLATGPGKVIYVFYWGYDNKEQDMHVIFLTTGPDVKKNSRTGPVSAVDVYQVLCKLLHIQPLPHSGDWSKVKDIFE